jgi:hypothetical protein
LRSLKLMGMSAGLHDQLTGASMTAISFEECTALPVKYEVHWRGDERRERKPPPNHLLREMLVHEPSNT